MTTDVLQTYEVTAAGVTYPMQAHPDSIAARALSAGIPYEHAVLEDMRQRVRGGVAVDVGAGIGNHSVYLAKVCGVSVVAYEPNPGVFDQLLGNVLLNDLEVGLNNPRATVEMVACALGDSPGRGFFPEDRGRVERNSWGAVPILTLDHEVGEDTRVGLIKVDVEGNEARVLLGATRTIARDRPLIYAEARSKPARARIDEVLSPLGYRLADVIPVASPVGRWEPR